MFVCVCVYNDRLNLSVFVCVCVYNDINLYLFACVYVYEHHSDYISLCISVCICQYYALTVSSMLSHHAMWHNQGHVASISVLRPKI